jgi:hypothetical protein
MGQENTLTREIFENRPHHFSYNLIHFYPIKIYKIYLQRY